MLSCSDHYALISSIDKIISRNKSDINQHFNVKYNKLKKIAKKANWNGILATDANLTTDLILKSKTVLAAQKIVILS